jgi:hypothetical protein
MLVVLAVMNDVEILLMLVVVTIIMTMALVMVIVTAMVHLEKFLGFSMSIDCCVYEYWLSVSRLQRHPPCS